MRRATCPPIAHPYPNSALIVPRARRPGLHGGSSLEPCCDFLRIGGSKDFCRGLPHPEVEAPHADREASDGDRRPGVVIDDQSTEKERAAYDGEHATVLSRLGLR